MATVFEEKPSNPTPSDTEELYEMVQNADGSTTKITKQNSNRQCGCYVNGIQCRCPCRCACCRWSCCSKKVRVIK